MQTFSPQSGGKVVGYLIGRLIDRGVPAAVAQTWVKRDEPYVAFDGPGNAAAFVADLLKAGGLTPRWRVIAEPAAPAPAPVAAPSQGPIPPPPKVGLEQPTAPSPKSDAQPRPIGVSDAPKPIVGPLPPAVLRPEAARPEGARPEAPRPEAARPHALAPTRPPRPRTRAPLVWSVVALALLGLGVAGFMWTAEPPPPAVASTSAPLYFVSPGSEEDAAYALQGVVHMVMGDAVFAGAVISEAGHILTVATGLPADGPVTVTFSNGQQRLGHVIETDEGLAVIKALKARKSEVFSPVDFADLPPQVGAAIHVLDSPHGLRLGLRASTVRDLRPQAQPAILTIDRTLMPGSLGAPVFDAGFRMLGLASDIQGTVRDLTFSPEAISLLSRYIEQVDSQAQVDPRYAEKAHLAAVMPREPAFIKPKRRKTTRKRRRKTYARRYYYYYVRPLYYVIY